MSAPASTTARAPSHAIRAARGALWVCLASTIACGARTELADTLGSTASSPAAEGSNATATCTWPANLDSSDADADSSACYAQPYLLVCSGGGLFWACLSDTLRGGGSCASTGQQCQSQCNAGEYAVACGPDDAGSMPGCRVITFADGLFVAGYCCPCE
jgi:hypothetical protein